MILLIALCLVGGTAAIWFTSIKVHSIFYDRWGFSYDEAAFAVVLTDVLVLALIAQTILWSW